MPRVEFFLRDREGVVIELDLVGVILDHFLVLCYVQQVVDFLDPYNTVVKHTVVALLTCIKRHLSATELAIIEATSPYIFSSLLHKCFIHLGHLSAELF